MEQTNKKTGAGKGLSVTGFIIALVALVGWLFASGAAVLAAAFGGGMGLAIGWAVFSFIAAALSIMGLMQARKGNGKKGLGIAGMAIGVIAIALSVRTVFAVKEVQEASKGLGTEMMSAFQNGMEQGLDSLNKEIKAANDSIN
ncbi:MAG: hypothetical protein ACJ76F_04535 [Bacteroidia bacterium]